MAYFGEGIFEHCEIINRCGFTHDIVEKCSSLDNMGLSLGYLD